MSSPVSGKGGVGRLVKMDGFRGPQGWGVGPNRAEKGSIKAVPSGTGRGEVGTKVGAKSKVIGEVHLTTR